VAKLTLESLSKRFGDVVALDEVDLTVSSGEFVAILGPSGCGKTTLLRMVAGFEKISGGVISFDADVQASATVHRPPEDRALGMVFQSYALWPHMTVAQNVGYPLRVRGQGEAERRPAVLTALDEVGLAGYDARRPAELSGGQRQRVALARCLVSSPRVVLFDEPLANLDMHLRESMMNAFMAFYRATQATMLYVTHDQSEAMAMADRIVVLDAGKIQQVAAPRTLYAEPANEMVARFVGRGTLCPVEVMRIADGQCDVRLAGTTQQLRTAATAPGAAIACLRPEQLRLINVEDETLNGTVQGSVYRGHVTTVSVTLEGDPDCTLIVDTTDSPPVIGSRVSVAIDCGWCIPRD
jgi:iron(III) transport system ATP-binding protein